MKYNSGMLANKLIDEVKEEFDTVSYITDETFIRIYNQIIEMLYSEIINHTNVYEIETMQKSIEDFPFDKEHIKDVYVNDIQLSRAKQEQKGRISNIWYIDNDDNLCFEVDFEKGTYNIRIYYNYIPEKLVSLNDEKTVPLPFVFLEIITSKIRGEIYKLLNEDALSAKWLGEYNNLIENFKIYMSKRYKKYDC